jgi:hypothetical protein
VVDTLLVLDTYSGKPNISWLFHYVKRQPRTGSVKMVRVACTLPVNPPGVAQGGGVLCSRVALDRFIFLEDPSEG